LDQRVRSDHDILMSQGSRLAVLEQQFGAYRSSQDLVFARQQEFNDFLENQSNEAFFVVSGLPLPPPKLTGGKVFNLSRGLEIVLSAIMPNTVTLLLTYKWFQSCLFYPNERLTIHKKRPTLRA